MGYDLIEFEHAIVQINSDVELMRESIEHLGGKFKGNNTSTVCPICNENHNMSYKVFPHSNNKVMAKCWKYDKSYSVLDMYMVVHERNTDDSRMVYDSIQEILKDRYNLSLFGFKQEQSRIDKHKSDMEEFKKNLENYVDELTTEIAQNCDSEMEYFEELIPINNSESDYKELSTVMRGLTTPKIRTDLRLDKPKKWLIDGLVPEKSFGFIVAPPKCGKSSFTYLLSKALSNGEDFMGHKTNDEYKVAYFLIDGTFSDLGNRFGYGKQGNTWLNDDKQLNCESILTGIPMVAKKLGVKVFIIDCLYRLTDNIVDGQVMIKTLDPLANMCEELGITILMVHHTNRDNSTTNSRNKVAGSDHINKIMDFMLLLEPTMTEQEQHEYCEKHDLDIPPQRFTVTKSQYRINTTGYLKYTCEIDDELGTLKYDRFSIGDTNKRATAEDIAMDYAHKTLDILKTLGKWDTETIKNELVRLTGNAKSTVEKNMKSSNKFLLDKGIIVKNKLNSYDYIPQG